MARPTKRELKNKKISQSLSKNTPEVMERLREAFSIGAPIDEASFYAGIDESTYYRWKKKNPKLYEGLEALRLKPILKARQEVVNGLIGFENSFKYLTKKRRDEFGDKLELDGNIDFSYNLKVIDDDRPNTNKETKTSS